MVRETGTPKKPGTKRNYRLLSEEIKRYIVREHARFRRPKHIIEQVEKIFGVEVTNLQVARYDPENAVYKAGKKLAEYFREERVRYVSNYDEVPSFHMKHRIATLERMAQRAEDDGNRALVAQFLEQIAKETGGMYSNRRQVEVAGTPDKPLQMDVRQEMKGLPEDVLTELAAMADRFSEGR